MLERNMMTDKLYEFVKQAKDYADKIPGAGYERRIWNNHFHSKFAELIIRECVEVAYSYDEPKMSGCGLIIGNSIESHFGIEK